ncbi:MAG: trigger factor [Acidobacteria bacterium]|nr:trigger factor [Acidobacteriota bacterium]
MSVVVSIEDLGGSQKQVKVSVPVPAVEAETDRVTAEYRKNAKIPGFRKGKVPKSMVLQRFADDIERDVVERLLPRYWKQAEAESELDLLLAPEVGAVNFEFGSELTFVATVDLRPEFGLGNLDSFDFPEEPRALVDEDVDQALEDLRRRVADWKSVDRSAARGDRVRVEITEIKSADAQTDEESGNQPQKRTFEVGASQVWEELSLAATGLSAGQRGEFEREFLDGAEVGKKKFEFRVEAVEERDLAPLNDAFAEKYGNFGDLADMRTGVRDNLTRVRREDHERARREALIEQLCDRHPFELPKRVVLEETQEMLKEYAGSLSRQGLDVERAGIDWQKMGENLTPQAEKRVRARLVLDAASKKLGVEVSEEELESALVEIARSQGRSSGVLRQELDRDGRLGELRSQLMRDTTINRLLGEPEPGAEFEAEAEAGAAEKSRPADPDGSVGSDDPNDPNDPESS